MEKDDRMLCAATLAAPMIANMLERGQLITDEALSETLLQAYRAVVMSEFQTNEHHKMAKAAVRPPRE